MADINDLSVTDASNTTRWAEGMARAAVNNSARALEGILARWHKDNNGSLATGGTSTAITVTLNQSSIAAWYDGLTFAARITTTCGATPTINPTGSGALGAKSLYWAGSGTQLAAGDLTSTAVAWFMYEATSDKVYVYAAPPYQLNGLLTTRGDIATRDASSPVRLAIGSASTVLRTDGTDPSWGKVAGAHIAMGSDAQGDVLYYNGSTYARLAAGTSGQFLKTQGAGANPTWASAGLVPIERKTSSAVASYDFITGIGSTYRTYKLIGWLQPATDQVELLIRGSDDGGSSFEDDAADYAWASVGMDGLNIDTPLDASDSEMELYLSSTTDLIGNASNELIEFEITFSVPSSTALYKPFRWQVTYFATDSDMVTFSGGGAMLSTAAMNGVRLLFNSGNIAAGDVTLYGVVNA